MHRLARRVALAFAGVLPAVAALADKPSPPPGPQFPPRWSAPGILVPLPNVAIRTGNHDGYGRVVLDLPAGANATLVERNGQLVAQLSGGRAMASVRPPRNLRGIDAEGAQVALTMAPGTRWRSLALPGRLVIDVLDVAQQDAPPAAHAAPKPVTAARKPFSGPAPRPSPVQAAPAPQAAIDPAPIRPSVPPAPAPEAAKPDAAVSSAPPPPAPAMAEPPPAPVMVTPTEPAAVSRAPLAPMALAATLTGHGVSLPFSATTAAAAFRRGPDGVVVFDERRPIDLAALRDDADFADARIQLLPAGTVLRLKLPAGMVLRLARDGGAWSVAELPEDGAPLLRPLRPEVADGQMRIATAVPGHVVSVPDPQTGVALLVGTLRLPGAGVALTRRTPEFELLATFQGVAVEAGSDALSLVEQPPGFVLRGAPERALAVDPLDADGLAAADAARLTRRWDFPSLPADALLRRLKSATDAAAGAPAQSRAKLRLAAVQAQLALGLGAEAHALATLAVTDDAREAELPDAAALDAVAALLAGRLREADALLDPRIDGSDEVALWRAVRKAQLQEGAPEAASVFAATMPLLLAYPAALRDRLLPLAAETMALGGERAAARHLLDLRHDDGALDYARAILDEAEGHAAPSLATLDRLAQSSDRRLRSRAAVRAVELRLRMGALDTAAAADALDRLIYSWRGDGQEVALRDRVATLRTQSGNWRAALALLRESAELATAPEPRAVLRDRMTAVFAEAMAQEASTGLPPLDLVSLIEENPDLLPPGDAGHDLAVRLADRLAALDLPRRAEPVLHKLMNATPAGPARAELGARLAALRLEENDAGGALMALSGSVAPDLPDDLIQRRTIEFARATAAKGSLPAALAALAALEVPQADDARAALLEAAKDLPATSAALQALAARTLPPDGPLSEAQSATLLRLASAAAQTGDEALLTRLREHDAARLPAGKLLDMFRLLTERPIQSAADLPRAAKEAALARNFPAALKSLAAP